MKILAYASWLRKGIFAFVAPGATIIMASVYEKSAGGSAITKAEWITAICACVITSVGVAGLKNGDKPEA